MEEPEGTACLLMDAAQDLMAGTFDECPMAVMGRTGFHRVFPEGIAAMATDDGANRQLPYPANLALLELRPSQGSSLRLEQIPSQQKGTEFIRVIEISRWRYLANGEILDNNRLIFYETVPKSAFVDLQCPDFRFKRRTRNAEPGCCPSGSEDPPATGV